MTAAECRRLETRLTDAEDLFFGKIIHGEMLEIRTALRAILTKVTAERIKAEEHEFRQRRENPPQAAQ